MLIVYWVLKIHNNNIIFVYVFAGSLVDHTRTTYTWSSCSALHQPRPTLVATVTDALDATARAMASARSGREAAPRVYIGACPENAKSGLGKKGWRRRSVGRWHVRPAHPVYQPQVPHIFEWVGSIYTYNHIATHFECVHVHDWHLNFNIITMTPSNKQGRILWWNSLLVNFNLDLLNHSKATTKHDNNLGDSNYNTKSHSYLNCSKLILLFH